MAGDSTHRKSSNAASANTTWHEGAVSRADRERLLGQRGATVWFTGLSGSGKSTIAVAVESRLVGSGRLCYRIDGDNLRHGLNRNLGFSPDDRAENVRRTGEVCRILADSGVIVLASLVSPFIADRAAVRALHDEWGIPFLEAFVDVPLDVAESRDPKGLYKKARAGEIRDFTGIHQPYESPLCAELVIDSSKLAVSAAAECVIAELLARGIS
jgi:adenylylsulfate kinase